MCMNDTTSYDVLDVSITSLVHKLEVYLEKLIDFESLLTMRK